MSCKSLQTEMVQAGVHSLAEVPDYVSVPKVPPIYMSSVFSFDDVPSLDAVYAKEAPGYVYSRDGNPGTDYTASMIAQAEGGESGLVFSSGMAAILQSIIAYIGKGDHIVSSPVLYGGVDNYLKNVGAHASHTKDVPNFETLMYSVEHNDGYAYVGKIRPSGFHNLRLFPYNDGKATHQLCMAWKEDNESETVRRFTNYIRKRFQAG